jgi:hypothetical protein
MITNVGIKPLAIGLGQGGGKIALKINSKFNISNKTILINTSSADLNDARNVVTDQDRVYKLGEIEQVEGTGKDRSISTNLALAMGVKLTDHIISCLLKDDEKYDVLILCFSTAGGTGSGLGPRLAGMLNTSQFLDKIRGKYGESQPIIIGLAATPDLGPKEGYLSMQNTLECLKEIQTLSQKQIARFFIASNSSVVGIGSSGNRTSYLDTINDSIAKYIWRYCSKGFVSAHNMEKSDRLAGLRIMGLHSISSIDSDGNILTGAPFITPEGESVRRVNFEIPSTWEKDFNTMLVSHGVVMKDCKEGLYDINDNTEGLFPIIGYHGFRDIKRFSEAFEARLQQIKKMNEKIERDNINLSNSFDGVADERAKRDDEYGEKHKESFVDVFKELI